MKSGVQKSNHVFRVRMPLLLCLCGCLFGHAVGAAGAPNDARVLLIVWDGMRPDLISPEDTPNLARLRAQGVDFSDHHSTYPTLTMINASSLATGAFPGTHGFYGNWIWLPEARGRDSADRIVDFTQPVFTEDYGILQAVDAAYRGRLFTVPTLFEVAARAKLPTAVIGKGGPTFVQNRRGTTPFVDDRTAMPLSFAQELSKASLPLPRLWGGAYPADADPTLKRGDDPTAGGRIPQMKDGVTTDPTQTDIAPFAPVNAYYARVLTDYVLPKLQPRLAMMWLRNPDSTEHPFGPGAGAVRRALRDNDALLGGVLRRLEELGLKTNVMIVSDHGHSHVSGPLKDFPLRAISDGVLGNADPKGFAASGEVRTVDLLRRAGLLAYDGLREQCNPIMSGTGADGLSIYFRKRIDAQFACKAGVVSSGDFTVPSKPPLHQPYAVVALDGGSEYFYVPSHDRAFVAQVVRALQSRKQYGPIFIDSKRYGELPGTLPLSVVHLANAQSRNPDLIVSFNFVADDSIGGVPGVEFSSSYGSSGRGTHGSFSPRDVHNILIASGPAFRAGFRDELPSANVDVAPTIAAILGLRLPQADGRVLHEALLNADVNPQLLRAEVLRPKQTAGDLKIAEATDPDGKLLAPNLSRYTIELHTKIVREGRREYRYFDQAIAVRD